DSIRRGIERQLQQKRSLGLMDNHKEIQNLLALLKDSEQALKEAVEEFKTEAAMGLGGTASIAPAITPELLRSKLESLGRSREELSTSLRTLAEKKVKVESLKAEAEQLK